ncbi:hypothetical protein [Peptoclostridium sp.]|nr:hypothetical protein [Peptoclostridium sp.]
MNEEKDKLESEKPGVSISQYIKKCTINGDTYENEEYRKEQGK